MRLTATLLLALTLSACANQKPEHTQKIEHTYVIEYEIISYFGFAESLSSMFKQLAEAAPNPEFKEYMLGAEKYLNISEFNEIFALQLSSKFSNRELDDIINFIRSPSGKNVQSVFYNLGDPTLAKALYSLLSTEDKAAFENFASTPTGNKLVAFLNSAEVKEISRSYGETLGCRYIAEHRKPDLERVKSMGVCLDVDG